MSPGEKSPPPEAAASSLLKGSHPPMVEQTPEEGYRLVADEDGHAFWVYGKLLEAALCPMPTRSRSLEGERLSRSRRAPSGSLGRGLPPMLRARLAGTPTVRGEAEGSRSRGALPTRMDRVSRGGYLTTLRTISSRPRVVSLPRPDHRPSTTSSSILGLVGRGDGDPACPQLSLEQHGTFPDHKGDGVRGIKPPETGRLLR